MKEQIEAALRALEQERGCRFLFAVESGSRAWGFASPDSDYDVRAVYVKPVEHYLQLEEPKDTIEAMLSGDLDISAWDLRKFLQGLLKSNASIMEWLGSPIVYLNDGLLDHCRELAAKCANPVHIAFHYAAMFRKAMDYRTPENTISVKKLCYALRANLCLRWVKERETMPPTAFSEVVAGLDLTESERQGIAALLACKSVAKEKEQIEVPSSLAGLLEDHYDELAHWTWKTHGKVDEVKDDLVHLFQKTVMGDI